MATEAFHIIHKGLKLEEIIVQVRNIDKFPCTVHMYDRVFMLSNKEEAWSIATGLELGWYLSEDFWGDYVGDEKTT